MTVLILGNGSSRKDFDLKLKGDLPIYGCNAVYRDVNVDKLFAIDNKIIAEINSSNFPKEKFVITPQDEQFEPAAWNPHRPRENSGMVAMRYAIREGHKTLILVGFDALVMGDYAHIMGNIYGGTNGYEEETAASFSDTKRRGQYFNWFVSMNSTIKFVFAFDKKYLSDNISAQDANVEIISYEEISKYRSE